MASKLRDRLAALQRKNVSIYGRELLASGLEDRAERFARLTAERQAQLRSRQVQQAILLAGGTLLDRIAAAVEASAAPEVPEVATTPSSVRYEDRARPVESGPRRKLIRQRKADVSDHCP